MRATSGIKQQQKIETKVIITVFGLVTTERPEGGGRRRGEPLAAPVIFNMLPTREALAKPIDSRQLGLNLRFQLKHCAPGLGVEPGSPISGVRAAWHGRGVPQPRIPEVAASVRPSGAAEAPGLGTPLCSVGRAQAAEGRQA